MLSSTEYKRIKEKSVTGRYVINEQIISVLEKLPSEFSVSYIGDSVQKRKIYSVTVGNGSNKILMWSQMHGNESTTTKAVLDLFNYLQEDTKEVHEIKANCTLHIIPMLNPDGADAYTRINANKIDLNRDAQNQTQPESTILMAEYKKFKPNYCFNLHDQRTIFNVGTTNKPATVSFLAPAHDEERTISTTRGISMQLIVAMNTELQKLIPGQVGRYDDGFNANCVGDTFQMLHIPTILFESGHYPNDYERETTRELIYISLLKAIGTISLGIITNYSQKDYTAIPENGKLFLDVLISNVEEINPNLDANTDIGILFKETLKDGFIEFVPTIEKVGKLKNSYYGHKTYNCLKDEELFVLKKEPFIELLEEYIA
ncbi:zinc carboxypeptidase [Maribacter vaceletii]|uniref:Zinc carboxypeptidase n=1 Tax=Maribacter vaceletii TaxID=1206816 RepID=A0A495E7J8_9FLAO|nr:M14 metallopeptidase family protein [Maribacter vaceletii]RKR12908.1 zinc carboxypeptidase [Maribacter vaceletii]